MTQSRPVVRASTGRKASGGTCAHVVEVDGVAVGWVYDGRPWNGSRFGGRTWSFALSGEGGRGASANGGGYGTRGAAVDALMAAREGAS